MSDRRDERRIALLLEYDGADFAGLQSQDGPRTVQDALERALGKLTGECRRISFAGRTDAGVHARGQVGSFLTRVDHDAETWRNGLNHFLPGDLAVIEACETARDFDPRRDAIARRYRYVIECGRGRAPLTRGRAWQLSCTLDVERMAAAAAMLPREGRDWAAFGGPVSEDYPTVRTLLECSVRAVCGGRRAQRVAITMEATGFLPHQVRRMAGALERVGTGALEPHEFAALIDGPPGSAGKAAPPQGLTLECIRYERDAVTWASGRMATAERVR